MRVAGGVEGDAAQHHLRARRVGMGYVPGCVGRDAVAAVAKAPVTLLFCLFCKKDRKKWAEVGRCPCIFELWRVLY